jgi:hypothetical protein
MELPNLFYFIATVTIFAAATLIGRVQWVHCMDRHGPAMGLAVFEALNAERDTPIEIRDEVPENIIEQGYRTIKQRTRPMLVARILLGGIEAMHIIAIGQMKHLTAPDKNSRRAGFISW